MTSTQEYANGRILLLDVLDNAAQMRTGTFELSSAGARVAQVVVANRGIRWAICNEQTVDLKSILGRRLGIEPSEIRGILKQAAKPSARDALKSLIEQTGSNADQVLEDATLAHISSALAAIGNLGSITVKYEESEGPHSGATVSSLWNALIGVKLMRELSSCPSGDHDSTHVVESLHKLPGVLGAMAFDESGAVTHPFVLERGDRATIAVLRHLIMSENTPDDAELGPIEAKLLEYGRAKAIWQRLHACPGAALVIMERSARMGAVQRRLEILLHEPTHQALTSTAGIRAT